MLSIEGSASLGKREQRIKLIKRFKQIKVKA